MTLNAIIIRYSGPEGGTRHLHHQTDLDFIIYLRIKIIELYESDNNNLENQKLELSNS